MKNFLRTASCLVLVLVSSACFAVTDLPKEHEQERLMLLLDSSISSEDWEKAGATIEKLQELDAELMHRFYYFQALYLKHSGQNQKAVSALTKYVVDAGKEGKYYRDALVLINELEDSVESAKSQVAPASSASLTGQNEGYVQALQALYLTSDPKAALLQQINAVLSAHPYRNSRVQGKGAATGIEYRVSIDGPMLMVQERSYMTDTPLLTLDKLKVLGVDPFLEYSCEGKSTQCVIYHPSKPQEEWIVIANDSMAASELVEAFSHLIRLMQR
jgi:hypothetical protein